ncbi:MAG TPA: serine/threonine-protein kinase [Gemmatimonadaceae bacterium]
MAEAKIADIGKYHIIELIGEGAMGVVYRANDSVLDRTVAIKVMNESIARQDDLRKRFLHEAQAAASLQHPNVVCIYDLGDFNGHLFIAMEFIQGVDLEKLLETGEPIALQARLDIVIDVLTGLTFAHKRGIIHRDIKPANIRVTEDGRAKIMDFGVAHLSSSSMTSTGSFLGTPSYMAPEQITEGKTSPATDIFAVGGVLYQLLTQMRPFESPTLQNLFFRIITETPKPVSELVPGLPPALDRIVAKAMAKEPSDRYATALEMANDLSNVRSKLSGPSYPASVSLSASVSGAIEQARKKSRSRSRNFAFAGAGAVFAVAVLIGWSQLSKSRAPTSSSMDQSAAVASNPSTLPTENASAPLPSARGNVTATPVPPPPAPTQETSRAAQTPDPLRGSPRKPSELSRAAARAADPPRSTPPRIATKTIQQQTTKTVQQPPISAAQPIVQPSTQNSLAQQQVVTSPPPAMVIPRPVQSQPVESPASSPPPAPTPPTTAEIAPSVQAYARAIESKDIGAVRHAYPGLTSAQQGQLETFFQAARTIDAKLRISSLDASPNSAEARVVGSYDYVTSEGRTETRPVSFAMSLRREGSGWRVVSVH